MSDLLLLSGGLDSTALGAWTRPDGCLFIDYGQRPAAGERRSATAVARALELRLHTIEADCSAVGVGTLTGSVQLASAPTPEWWPFRNQLLATLAAAYAVQHEYTTVLLGTVKGDGDRHSDGKPTFLDALDQLLAMQEGNVRLTAPAIAMTTVELVATSGVNDAVLAWSHSCHAANHACGRCPGCQRRAEVLLELGRLNHRPATTT